MTPTSSRRLRILATAAALAVVPAAQARADAAPPLRRDYQGPDVSPAPPPDAQPPVVHAPPPAAAEPAAPPSAPSGPKTPAAPLAPAPVAPSTPAPTPEPPPGAVADVPEDDGGGDFGFEVVDLTEDEQALAKELEVKSKKVKGPSGAVQGRVKDSVSGEPLIGAFVEAIGTGFKTKTDFQGNYTLELPPGQYEIRVRSDANQPRRISNVAVEADGSRTLNAELQPLEGAGQTVVVEAEMNKESAGARLLQRKESVGTRDLMSRDEIAKSGGGSTSAVARRIVGATLVGGRYIFVRGLGHRYGNTLFDGARVPSPEPELRTVPLDIFPSSALSAINVQKTFTPDVPADFAGGSIQLESREVPDEFMFEVSGDVGYNSATTFRQMLTSGGFLGPDAFAVGNVPRGLPSALPDRTPASRGVLDENYNPIYSPEDIARFGRSMYTDTRIRTGMAPVNWGLKATAGYGFNPYDNSKLGFLAAASYKNKHQTKRYDRFRQYGIGANGQLAGTPTVDYRGESSTYTVSWSTVGLAKYDINKNHRLELLGFYSREADDEARRLDGVARNVSGLDPIRATRLRYIMRSILMTRLGGKHEIPAAKGLTVDWFGSFAQAQRDDPAIREMLYTDAGGDGSYRIDRGNDSGKQTFLNLVDNTENGALNFTMPFKQWSKLDSKVKAGGWIEAKQRVFTVRRFQFQQDDVTLVPLGTANIINDGTIGGGDGDNAFFLQEGTRPTDNYEATQEIYAGYALAELPFVRWFKVAGGTRFEASKMQVNPFDPFGGPGGMSLPDESTTLTDLDWLPSGSLIFSPNDKHNIRLVGTGTLARPEFRELAPFVFTDFVGGADVQGNPDLKTTKIYNADLRWEWFPSSSEVIALSGFYKYFDGPIERIRVQAGSTQISSFNNADAAHNAGAELEARKTLEFVSKKIKDFSVGVNFAYIFSRVSLGSKCDIAIDPTCADGGRAEVSTNRVRPLQDQSPYVANTYLGYDNDNSGTSTRVLYNVAGPRIAEVGGAGLPDIYRQPQHDLQFVLGQRLHKGLEMSFSVGNMLNAPVYWTQQGKVVRRYYEGVDFKLGLTYRY